MDAPDTRTQLLDAAERLFAERGFAGASIRAITDLAGANLAAVKYHFGSKADLLTEVVRRVVEPIIAAQSAALDRLLARPEPPTVAELVEGFAGPLFDGMGEGSRSRLIVAIVCDPAEEMRRWVGREEGEVGARYLEAFARALPGVSREELVFRLRGVLSVTAVDRVGAVDGGGGEARRWVITFLAAAMSASATGA
ncbi:TetR/AcrR family transcriptional regulator [Actinosynnema pretiosum]|uniref:TetR/AcrR family transcriptional regulator n=1 Tax=Actinosynnema pretiosum TaxID=42197 RepID=UPI0020A297F9|nr:TetR family transcriptional regulator [Actinosynnema pretiosum]